MIKSMNILGVDLGGTNIRVGKVIDDRIVKVSKVPTPMNGTEKDVLEKLYSAISDCIDTETQSIGVGVPSVVDTKKGIVYDVVNIPSWKEVPLRELLYNKFHVPININNDSNCFAAGEKMFGKGKPYQNIVGMTIGTGLGLGLIVNGKLYEGKNCGAGELGMIPYLDDICENYCSGQFFSKIHRVDAAEMHEKAKQGDQMALKLFNDFGMHMGKAVKLILYLYDPDIIIMGGSISNAFEFFKSSMYVEVKDFAFRNILRNLKIEISSLSDSAIMGAAALHQKLIEPYNLNGIS
jgi:glucokinase